MAQLVLAIFLLVFGFNMLLGLGLPGWLLGLLAVAAGVLLLIERLNLRGRRK
jgi:hypothetical protein